MIRRVIRVHIMNNPPLISTASSIQAITPTHKPVVTHYLDGSSTEPEENNIVKASFNVSIQHFCS